MLKQSGKKSSDSHAAVWVPDSETNTCMHCKKVQFTLVNRRHHCRKCGVVCCNTCSSKRFLLPAQSSKPLRVCMTCFEELTMQSAGGENSFNRGNNKEHYFEPGTLSIDMAIDFYQINFTFVLNGYFINA